MKWYLLLLHSCFVYVTPCEVQKPATGAMVVVALIFRQRRPKQVRQCARSWVAYYLVNKGRQGFGFGSEEIMVYMKRSILFHF